MHHDVRQARRAPSARRSPPHPIRARPPAAGSPLRWTARPRPVGRRLHRPPRRRGRPARRPRGRPRGGRPCGRVSTRRPSSPVIAGRLERARDGQDLGHVGEPLAQQPLETPPPAAARGPPPPARRTRCGGRGRAPSRSAAPRGCGSARRPSAAGQPGGVGHGRRSPRRPRRCVPLDQPGRCRGWQVKNNFFFAAVNQAKRS